MNLFPTKRLLTLAAIVCLLILTGSDALFSKSSQKADSKAQSLTADQKKTGAEKVEGRKIIVYYFHGKFRCMSCRKIETYTEEAVKSFFADDIKNKKLNYQVVDVEEKGNEHFAQDYQLYTKSVVVVDTLNGKQVRWKNLPKVWELLRDKDSFKKYIRDEIMSYQKAG